MCPGDYLLPVGRAPKWYTPGENPDKVLVKHVVMEKVQMEEFSETNPIPRSANRKKAESMGALRISTESDDFIFDEIHRRDRLEDEEFEDEMEENGEEDELEDEYNNTNKWIRRD